MLQAFNTRETREAAREVKFLVTPDLAERILEWSRSRLAPDPHASGASGDEYQTTSLYFDTGAFAVYHRQGSFKRSKYRIRRYGSSDMVFLERKLRTSTMLSKRRTTVPIADLQQLTEAGLDTSWAGRWFEQRIAARQLAPVSQVSYHRHARVGSGLYGPMRLTFDDKVKVQPCYGLQFDPPAGVPVLETHTIIEMKYRAELPAVLRRLIEEFALQASPVSKYRLSLDALRQSGLPTGATRVNLNDVLHGPAVRGEVNA
jgi:hypothetical protein